MGKDQKIKTEVNPVPKIAEALVGKTMTVNLGGKKYDVHFRTSFYTLSKSPAIELVLADGEPFGTLTVNIPEALEVHKEKLGDMEIVVKTWSENEALAEAALKTGLFEDTGRRISTGFVLAQIWRVKAVATNMRHEGKIIVTFSSKTTEEEKVKILFAIEQVLNSSVSTIIYRFTNAGIRVHL
jgi:hypothetical protein